jgi:hypothetical protein
MSWMMIMSLGSLLLEFQCRYIMAGTILWQKIDAVRSNSHQTSPNVVNCCSYRPDHSRHTTNSHLSRGWTTQSILGKWNE